MDDTDKRDFAELITGAHELYGKSASIPVIRLWWTSLKRFPFADVQQAMSAHVQDPRNGRFIPKPADLIRIIDGDPDSKAMVAWHKVEQAIAKVGPYQSVVFDDPVIHFVIEEMGGWEQVNSWSEKDIPYRGNDFRKLYASSCNREISYAGKLKGIAELSNNMDGYDPPAPKLVGDPERAKAVLVNGSESVKKLGVRSVDDISKALVAK